MELGKDLKVIVFDFDGTLHGLELDWGKARQILGIADTNETIGDAIERLKGAGDQEALRALDDLEWDFLQNRRMDEKTCDMLDGLGGKYGLAILSRNSETAIRKFVDASGVEIDYVVGRESVRHLKPHPEGLLRIADYFDVRPREILVVGDTWHDLEVAQNAGCVCVIVGNNCRRSVPEYRIERVADLTKLLI